MKKLLVGLLTLGSISSYANTLTCNLETLDKDNNALSASYVLWYEGVSQLSNEDDILNEKIITNLGKEEVIEEKTIANYSLEDQENIINLKVRSVDQEWADTELEVSQRDFKGKVLANHKLSFMKNITSNFSSTIEGHGNVHRIKVNCFIKH